MHILGYFNIFYVLFFFRYPLLKEKVENARKLIEEYLVEKNYLDEKLKKISDKGILLSGYRPITHHSIFL